MVTSSQARPPMQHHDIMSYCLPPQRLHVSHASTERLCGVHLLGSQGVHTNWTACSKRLSSLFQGPEAHPLCTLLCFLLESASAAMNSAGAVAHCMVLPLQSSAGRMPFGNVSRHSISLLQPSLLQLDS